MYFSEPRSCSLILWSACAFLSAVSSAAFADEKEKPVSANDLEAVEMGLVFNPVVRHTDTGRPVTLRQQTIINMAKKIVEIRRRSGDDAEDLKIRAKAAAELQARKKAVAARIAAGEKIVTKNFIIPGTTPQESKRIHSKNSGLRAADANDGSNRTRSARAASDRALQKKALRRKRRHLRVKRRPSLCLLIRMSGLRAKRLPANRPRS